MEKRLTADLNVVANSNLEIQLLDGDLNIIQKLDDEPNDVGGLTSAELKAKFDESGNIIKKYINETLIPAVLAEDATEESRKQAEAARVAAEQGRVTAEQERVRAEEARAASETARASAEQARDSAETARSGAESTRQSQEATRQTAEAERNSAETARAQSEQSRSTAETARGNAETARREAETSRATAESNRAVAEQSRVSEESTRVQNENQRVSAEGARAAAEAAREAAERARADENTGIVAQATAQANAAAGSAESASASAQTAQSASRNAGTAASTASSAASTASTAAEAASGSASQASAAAAAAAQSAASVDGINKTAQSWAVGGTGTRPGEDMDNAKYWAEQAEAVVGGDFATKNEAQGYVTAHNQSADAHADIRKALKDVPGHIGNSDIHVTAEQKTMWNGKQSKLKGTAGQFVGFDASGNAIAVAAPNSLYLDSIAIATPATKLAYKAGEVFNPAGMVVKANYTNGTVIIAKDIVVTGWAVDPSGALEAGRTYVTVQYTENGVTKTARQAVTVTKTVLTVPTQSGTLTYNGGAQSPSWSNYDTGKMTLGGVTSDTNAGSYNATFTIKNTALYCWPDGSTEPRTVAWTIGKAPGTLSLSKSSMTLQPGTTSGTFTLATNSSGAISVNNDNTAIASATRSGNTVTVASVGNKSGTAVITVSVAGDANHTAPASKTCSVKCSFVSIYGVQWDGTATTLWSRTDDAAGFTNPSPAVNNGTGSSPFDGKMPWAGMVKETDATAGVLVKIPKFWYKWTRSGRSMKLQIADAAVDGFHTSPAHADRGDGKGERDYVYVGRYHCDSGYKSQAGSKPRVNMTRAHARTDIHNLGAAYWQYDYAMFWTIRMLYLVEYGGWHSQETIGYGCSPRGSLFDMGATDGMKYHTGTTAASRTTYGSIQYRYIEGLWDNGFDWCDGIYFSGANVYCIKNPAQFSDTANGTLVGTRATSSNYISEWTNPTASGFEYALYPNAVNGTENTYVCDYCDYRSSGVVLYVGAYYYQNQSYGAFYLGGNYGALDAYSNIGCRLQKLP